MIEYKKRPLLKQVYKAYDFNQAREPKTFTTCIISFIGAGARILTAYKQGAKRMSEDCHIELKPFSF